MIVDGHCNDDDQDEDAPRLAIPLMDASKRLAIPRFLYINDYNNNM